MSLHTLAHSIMETPTAQSLWWFQRPIGNWRTHKRNVEAIPDIAAATSKKKTHMAEIIVADAVKVCLASNQALGRRGRKTFFASSFRVSLVGCGLRASCTICLTVALRWRLPTLPSVAFARLGFSAAIFDDFGLPRPHSSWSCVSSLCLLDRCGAHTAIR